MTALKSSFVALLLTLACRSIGQAQDVAAILSSESAPYQEALAGVQEVLGGTIPVVNLTKSEKIPPARILITIGGKATLRPYPPDTTIIYCVALGVVLKPESHAGQLVRVSLSPAPVAMLQKIKELQPDLKRLGVLWISDTYDHYMDRVKSAAPGMGLQLEGHRLKSPQDLPDALRALKNRVDALWVPPDPLLLSQQSFTAMSEFSLSSRIPLYAPIDSLADKGATASIATSFRDMGRKAGDIARQLLSGRAETADNVYVERITVTLNEGYAAKVGLALPPAVRSKADRTIP